MSQQGEPRLLGLDDPKVRICWDRGEHDYRTSHPGPSANLLPHVSDHSQCDHGINVIKIIKCELGRVQVSYPADTHSSFFIPRHKLRYIVTSDRVLQIIQQLACCQHLSLAEKMGLRDRICFERDVRLQCWKLLVVLLRNGRQEQLLTLINGERVSDQCLPIRVNSPCRIRGHYHPTIDAWSPEKRCKASKWSYALNAPFFTRQHGYHNHYILETNDVRPITKTYEKSTSPDAPIAHQRTASEQETISSGFSEVRIVELDPGHYSFHDAGSWNPQRGPRKFALKKLHSADRATFSLELASLRRVQDQRSKHLIEVLATFEIRRDDGPTTYYFLFPCAQGDLWTFWKMHQLEQQRIPRAVWMAEQMYQIAKALLIFHNERENHLRLAGPLNGAENGNSPRNDLYGRHGDLKADNILYFEDEDRLVITDFGLGRLNSKYSRSGVDPKSVDKTATYKAPEFDLIRGRLSRVSDIFSLGCTYLEFVTWYLEGWEAVSKTFVDYRMEKDLLGFEVDTFFRIEGDGTSAEGERAVIKPKVREWIQWLRRSRHSSCYTLQLLELIENKMLEPDANIRVTSRDVVPELRLLMDTCQRNPSFYQDYCDRLPSRSGYQTVGPRFV